MRSLTIHLPPPFVGDLNRPDTFSHQHASALHWATWGGHTDIVKLLLEHKVGVPPELRTRSGDLVPSQESQSVPSYYQPFTRMNARCLLRSESFRVTHCPRAPVGVDGRERRAGRYSSALRSEEGLCGSGKGACGSGSYHRCPQRQEHGSATLGACTQASAISLVVYVQRVFIALSCALLHVARLLRTGKRGYP